ncbi:MAG: T9SS C-terminal target domain-containing protein, partial [Bacteroidota bacterium]
MKKLLLLLLFASCFLHFTFSQNPLVKQWDYRFGGTDNDFLTWFEQTKDGGYILGGYSYSDSSGDKTQDNWDTICNGFCTPDYWIIKIDSIGNKQWEKNFGGTSDDLPYSLQQTADGGYILGGVSHSGISGDKTDSLRGGMGDYDFWIVKTDSLGNKQWDKDFGGFNYDQLTSMLQTVDGGYILGGFSNSDSSGDKTQNSHGSEDYWIVKIDSLGNKQWDKDFGGADDDRFHFIQQTADKGYILGGNSNSGISGDKTQTVWGLYDYWILKTDSLGNKLWDKDFGGTYNDILFSLKQTADGGYILGGISQSGIGGDKSQPTWGAYDYWIVKTDSLGNKQWDKDFGGTGNEDNVGNISQT